MWAARAGEDGRQWGRGQTAAERRRAAVLAGAGVGRQWGRGQTAAERFGRCASTPPPSGVNGAAAKRPRKGLCARARRPARPASMGPRPNGRGKAAPAAHPTPYLKASMGPRPNGRGKIDPATERAGQDLRQWGRGQTAAESVWRGVKEIAGDLASMGPRPNGRGKWPRTRGSGP